MERYCLAADSLLEGRWEACLLSQALYTSSLVAWNPWRIASWAQRRVELGPLSFDHVTLTATNVCEGTVRGCTCSYYLMPETPSKTLRNIGQMCCKTYHVYIILYYIYRRPYRNKLWTSVFVTSGSHSELNSLDKLPVAWLLTAVRVIFIVLLSAQIIEGWLLVESHQLSVFPDAEGEGWFMSSNKVLCMGSNPLVNDSYTSVSKLPLLSICCFIIDNFWDKFLQLFSFYPYSWRSEICQ